MEACPLARIAVAQKGTRLLPVKPEVEFEDAGSPLPHLLQDLCLPGKLSISNLCREVQAETTSFLVAQIL